MHERRASSLPAMQGTNFGPVLPYATSGSRWCCVPDAGQFSQVESSLDATALGIWWLGWSASQFFLPFPFKVETGTSLG